MRHRQELGSHTRIRIFLAFSSGLYGGLTLVPLAYHELWSAGVIGGISLLMLFAATTNRWLVK